MTPPPHSHLQIVDPPSIEMKLYAWLDMEIDKRFEMVSMVTPYSIHRQTVLREVRNKLDEILTEPTPACPNCHLVPIIWDEQYGTVCRCQFCGATVQVNGKGNLTRVVE